MVYPDGVWYAQVRASDVAEIVEEHLVNGRLVERLALLSTAVEKCTSTKDSGTGTRNSTRGSCFLRFPSQDWLSCCRRFIQSSNSRVVWRVKNQSGIFDSFLRD